MINTHYSVYILNSSFMFELVVLMGLAFFYLIALSAIFWSIKMKLSKKLNIIYRDRNMSLFADLVVTISTPLLIFSFAVDVDLETKHRLIILVFGLLVLNLFAFVKKESIKKYIILTLTFLIVFSAIYYLSIYLYLKYVYS